jgi:uncharacterized phosphosugar-binding protein
VARKSKSVASQPKKDSQSGSAALQFHAVAISAMEQVARTQIDAILAASRLCADKIANGGLVFLFGSGHSRMMVDEMTPRQGCFVGFVPLVEMAVTNYSAIVGANGLRATLHLEKYESYAEEILQGFRFGPNDAFIIISTSGIRPLAIEMAIGAKSRNLPVIAIVSRKHCELVQSGHSSGRKLTDVADIVIDNETPAGDCALELPGLQSKTGPLSSLTGALIINMVRCESARMLLERGHAPVMFPSHQFVQNNDAEDQADRFYESYRKSLAHLYA